MPPRAAAQGVIVALRLWNEGGAETRNGAIEAFLHEKCPGEWPEPRGGSFRLRDNLYLERAKKFDWPDLNAQERGTQFCYGLRDQLGVLADGTAVPCCLDHEGDIALGNLFTQPLAEILQANVRALREGLFAPLSERGVCRRCGFAARTDRRSMNEQERLNAPLTAPLLTWYDIHKRVLPWRGIRDPYRIWVSEIMLQQTRVQAVLEYYAALWQSCPTCTRSRQWARSGFSSSGRVWLLLPRTEPAPCGAGSRKRLRREFPPHARGLLRLPGVGDYTASAIASIAFGEPEPAVDGNLLRVAARVGGIAEDIMDARVRKRFRAMLTESIDCERPGEWNQAMMDLGATVCLPNGAPLCEKCPARAFCAAYQT